MQPADICSGVYGELQVGALACPIFGGYVLRRTEAKDLVFGLGSRWQNHANSTVEAKIAA